MINITIIKKGNIIFGCVHTSKGSESRDLHYNQANSNNRLEKGEKQIYIYTLIINFFAKGNGSNTSATVPLAKKLRVLVSLVCLN